ncbi:hypothetical protein BDV12DRAFT_200977 [Aspergillus spectabilis]
MATDIFPLFGQGVGYGIMIGLAGLIASSVVSSWTLSATLLSTTNFGYLYGIGATFWFGPGCSVPILTFAVLAIELKRKAPNAHTFLKLVKHRYGAPGHIVLAVYFLIYQIFISVNLLVGGAAVFHLTTTFGLGAAALEHTPAWPTYPDPISPDVISQAVQMPYVAYAILGKGGVVAVLLMLFQAITSALSSETVAITSLVTYDFYRAYIKPSASGKELIFVSHVAVVVYSILVALVAVGLCYAHFSVSFIVTAIGIIIDGAVIPSSKYGVTLVPVLTSIASIGTWIRVTYRREGVVSVATLSDFYPCVAGNMLALTAPIVLTPLVTYNHPENYDFAKFQEIELVDDSNIPGSEKAQPPPETKRIHFLEGLLYRVDCVYVYLGVLWSYHDYLSAALAMSEADSDVLCCGCGGVEWEEEGG